MTAQILRDVFDLEQRTALLAECNKMRDSAYWDADRLRLTYSPITLNLWAEKLLPLARETFAVPDIEVTYSCWALYESEGSSLEKHRDDNACTFTLDYCVRQTSPWPIYVEGQSYSLGENEALAFRGEDQEHWRDDLQAGESVEMIFFHFVRPSHWWFVQPWRRNKSHYGAM